MSLPPPSPGPPALEDVPVSEKMLEEVSRRLEAKIAKLHGWVLALVCLDLLLFGMALVIIILLRMKLPGV